VTRLSPRSGWKVFVLWGEGCVPDLEAAGPGAREVIVRYAIRYLQEEGRAGAGQAALKELRGILPGLDGDTVGALRAAGIPADDAALEHAMRVFMVRDCWHYWNDGSRDSLFLSQVCEYVLARKTVRAEEIGVTGDEVWREARGPFGLPPVRWRGGKRGGRGPAGPGHRTGTAMPRSM
jgi:hypothetical protein